LRYGMPPIVQAKIDFAEAVIATTRNVLEKRGIPTRPNLYVVRL